MSHERKNTTLCLGCVCVCVFDFFVFLLKINPRRIKHLFPRPSARKKQTSNIILKFLALYTRPHSYK